MCLPEETKTREPCQLSFNDRPFDELVVFETTRVSFLLVDLWGKILCCCFAKSNCVFYLGSCRGMVASKRILYVKMGTLVGTTNNLFIVNDQNVCCACM
jgi:hypothetical protein